MLDVNYRSNKTLVDFSHNAGYRRTLSSHSPDLRLHLLPSATPAVPWPSSLFQTPEWDALLDPDHPATCFVYPEGSSSQWNAFEAEAVAALVMRLYGRMANQLDNERDAAGAILPPSNAAYSPAQFWEKAIGIVTPHRAQEGLIVGKLQRSFSGTGTTLAQIRDAVDTVERFQGQQRDVIIASFALGDPDAIADEDKFLLSLRRFNVMASRARAKLIVLVSREVVDHLSNDIDVLRDSQLLKQYVESFCCQQRSMTLGYVDQAGAAQRVDGTYRYR
jgi:hypothetical protein